MLVILAGLPGTGKSTLAKEISRLTGAAILNKDKVRAAIFSETDIEFSTEQDDLVVESMLRAAQYLLKKDPKRVVILDGRTFSLTSQIDRVIAFAESVGAPWRILECICSDSVAKARIEASQALHPAGNRNFELYLDVKSCFEPISYPKTLINTENSLEITTKEVLKAIKGGEL